MRFNQLDNLLATIRNKKMHSNLLFDFVVDKENKTIHIKREFKANVELVWTAWTTAELLDQWWGPEPYSAKTKSMDFREGGIWLYAMVSHQDEKTWCKADYKKIETNKLFSWLDTFCDENGNENIIKPRSIWTNIFTEENNITMVNMTLTGDKLEDIEQLISTGFKEGFTIGLNQLDELLLTLKK